jgi:hypothetical protein
MERYDIMENYFNLLLNQVDKNRQINALAKEGRDAIARGDIGVVMESGAVRREIISQLKALQSEMDPYLEDLPKKLAHLSPQLKDQILTVSKQLNEIISETIAIDQENEIKLMELKEGIGDKIKEVGRGKKALSGYKSPSQNAPKLFDGEV